MQGFELKDLLQDVGPTASLIFAAWIFLTFLQQRYTTAYEHYRKLIAEYRKHGDRDVRRQCLEDQILEYKRRCQQMRHATNIGVVAAILLMSVLVIAAVDTMIGHLPVLKYLTGACAIVGLLLVILASVLVIIENTRLQLIVESELSDVPDLARDAHDKHHVGAQHSAG
jgi:hypothetical protein